MHKLTWYQELGFLYNPFTIKPAFFNDEIIGYDTTVDAVVTCLKEGNILFLQGEYGQGKTSMLKYLINEFKGKRHLIHVSRNRSDRALQYKKILISANNWFGRLFSKPVKHAILIVDETENINLHDCEQIESLFESNYLHAVLFMDKSLEKANISPSLKERIGKNIFELKPISESDAISLVRSRLEDAGRLISDALIKKVFAKSKKNTRTFLLLMEEVFLHAYKDDRQEVQEQDLAHL